MVAIMGISGTMVACPITIGGYSHVTYVGGALGGAGIPWKLPRNDLIAVEEVGAVLDAKGTGMWPCRGHVGSTETTRH